MSAAEPPRRTRALAALTRWLPFLLVTLFGLHMIWPVPTGVMPLSADHTVHLTRAYLYGQQLAGGHLVDWNPTWFFGFPLGELYPVLGDLGIIALRVLSLGLLDWPQAYALLFTLVFLMQGWVLLRCGRALGWGPVPGTIAGLLVLADVGAYREGGWTYTVMYGVWPQALATTLAWLTFAELALAGRPVPKDSRPRRHLAHAALAAGGSLLAHPMAILMLALGAPIYLVTVGLRGPDRRTQLADTTTSPTPAPPVLGPREDRRTQLADTTTAPEPHGDDRRAQLADTIPAPDPHGHDRRTQLADTTTAPDPHRHDRRTQLADTTVSLALVLGLGTALAAWWLLPMTAHRGWMANYGWLHAPLADMARMASKGAWMHYMPPAVGHVASLGLVIAALFGHGPLRFFALWAVAHWLLASTDIFWNLRLDWLSGGFQHIQYQRFLTAAKPGFFLLAGAAIGGMVHLALRTWSKRHVPKRILAAALLAAALALTAWQAVDTRAMLQRTRTGAVQVERMPGQPAFDADYAAFLAWARERWDTRDADYRMAFRADRNLHWFMDAPVTTHTPSYKIGFTPADNFVHKPESGDPALLRRLGVRHVVGTGSTSPAGSTLVERFGKIHVFELAGAEPLAHIVGEGTVTVEEALPGGEGLRLRVADVRGDARLVIHVAGYPRWELSWQPDGGAPEPVEWFEAPVLGDEPTASQAQRRGGELRGGKALGDDGHEPTLIAAPAQNGTYTLQYIRWRSFDILGLALALLGAAGIFALARRGDAVLVPTRSRARRLAPPLLLLLLTAALVLAFTRYRAGATREHDLASARLGRGEAASQRMTSGPLKTDMIIFPAVLAKPGRAGTSEVIYPRVQLGPTLDGWVAIDDDDAKLRRRGNHRLWISARPTGTEPWTPILDLPVPHRSDRRRLEDVTIPAVLQDIPVDLQIRIETTGEAPPQLGFDLELRAAR